MNKLLSPLLLCTLIGFSSVLLAVPALAQDNPVTDGIALWLRGDAGITLDTLGRVEAWQGQSDDAFVFSQVAGVDENRRPLLARGALNGRNVVRFDGGDFLTGGDILDNVFAGPDQRFVLFAVLHSLGGENDIFLAKNADSNFNQNQRQILYRVLDGKADFATFYALGSPPSIPLRGVSTAGDVVDTTLVLTFEYDGTQQGNNGLDRFGIRFDGTPEPISFSFALGALGEIQDGTAPVTVGAEASVAGDRAFGFFEGDIAELILYDRLLTAVELQQVEAYLGEKYGLDSPNFDLTMTPTSPLTASPGGAFSFDYTIANNTANTATGDFYFVARRNGNPVAQGVVRSGSLPGGQTIQASTTLNVPGAAPPGDYELTFNIGNAFSQSVDDVTYTVTVEGAAREGGTAWSVAEASPWTPVETKATALPETVALDAPYPNPTSGQATVGFALPEAGAVRLAVYDVLGREVAVLVDAVREAGIHTATLDARSLAGGLYLVRLDAGDTVQTQRVTLVR